ncbi:hypothetical protein ACFQVC_28490 [Streptomyces monticola]|uniref:Uncharacterized protein n=1 Tax=Streptomyces monticola TaxID=2666263 RepID=A0ABW2JRA6_9ACTN
MAPDTPDAAPHTPSSTPPSTRPRTPPSTPEQALAIVRGRYAEPKLPDGSPAQMRVHEFDVGYLVYAIFPPTTDAAGRPRPAPLGGSHVVVSKDTGETFTIPNFPTEQAIALYKKIRARNA